MKLSRTGWLILGGGLFVLLLGVLGMIYAGQVREQGRLTEDRAQAEIILGKLVSSKQAGEQVKGLAAQQHEDQQTTEQHDVQVGQAADAVFHT